MRIDLLCAAGLLATCIWTMAVSETLGHNGAVAFAYPVSGITVDGNLDDWPSIATKYPVDRVEFGEKPNSKRDSTVYFRIGFNEEQQALYVAVETTDESLVVDNTSWNTHDSCNLFIDNQHFSSGRSVTSYYYRAEDSYSKDDVVQVSAKKTDWGRIYEWQIRMKDAVAPNRTLGFDVAVNDKDEDGSFSCLIWGPGMDKGNSRNRTGDVLLLDSGSELGTASGLIAWSTAPTRNVEQPLPPIAIRSLNYPELSAQVIPDEIGEYSVTLPTGSYIASPVSYIAHPADQVVDENTHVHLFVVGDRELVANPLLVPWRSKLGIVPETGVLHKEEVNATKIDHFVQAHMLYEEIPGLSLAVIKNGEVIHQRGYGEKAARTGDAVSAATVFEAASMTKPVFAFAVLRLVEKGVLELDTPLYKYLPYEDIAHDDRYKLITTRHVLCHRTGFPNWRWENEDNKLDIKFTPGTQFGYSGEGFEYLAKVVAHIARKPVERVVEDEVFKLLGIDNAYLRWNDETHPGVAASPHLERDNRLPKRQWPHSEMAASLHIDASNYAKLLIAVHKRVGLRDELFGEMLRPHSEVRRFGQVETFGLGFQVADSSYGLRFGHGGRTTGFTCMSEFYDELGSGFVVMVNNDQARKIAEALRGYLITGTENDRPSR